MLPDGALQPITRDNLIMYLKDLAKEFRKLGGTKTEAEIILIGGAAILARYGFRELTYDVDAIIDAPSMMKDAINRVGDKNGLPHGWLNADFKRTDSYSDKLSEVSVYYKTFSNIMTIRTIAAEYLLAMKLKSGRQYKNDLSDIIGVLWDHQKNGEPIPREAVENAFIKLYGADAVMPETSRKLLDAVYANEDYEPLFSRVRESEIESRKLSMEFERDYANTSKAENIDGVIERMKQKREAAPQKGSLLDRLEEAKRKAISGQ
jgi:hypothetical protein